MISYISIIISVAHIYRVLPAGHALFWAISACEVASLTTDSNPKRWALASSPLCSSEEAGAAWGASPVSGRAGIGTLASAPELHSFLPRFPFSLFLLSPPTSLFPLSISPQLYHKFSHQLREPFWTFKTKANIYWISSNDFNWELLKTPDVPLLDFVVFYAFEIFCIVHKITLDKKNSYSFKVLFLHINHH